MVSTTCAAGSKIPTREMVRVAWTRKKSKGLAIAQKTGIIQFSFGERKSYKRSVWNRQGKTRGSHPEDPYVHADVVVVTQVDERVQRSPQPPNRSFMGTSPAVAASRQKIEGDCPRRPDGSSRVQTFIAELEG